MSSPPPYPGNDPQDQGRGYPQDYGRQPPAGYPERPPQGDGHGGYGSYGGGYGGGYGGPPAAPPRNGVGIAALVFGVLALLTGLFLIGSVFGLVAIALGIIGISRAGKGVATNRGVAISGLVLGVLGIALTVVVVVLFSSVFTAVGGGDFVDCVQRAGGDQAAMQQCQTDFEDRLQQESRQLGG